MTDFYTTLTYLNKLIYEPNDFILKAVQEEKQNAKYGAGTFRLRVANVTPNKVGQFVAF